ncbi:unnamed protein product [Paramecium pentaurelia]|uniref:Uncharacterized protein n=1 Tax=Paramecium pentaurelia TaxID=43138 RepID=A0A8S1YEN1_9CILI|nr:unnamed protein product [Paramecium pentaurelia]
MDFNLIYKKSIKQQDTSIHMNFGSKDHIEISRTNAIILIIQMIDRSYTQMHERVELQKYQKLVYVLKIDFYLQNDDTEIIKIFSPSETLLIIYNNLLTIKICDLEMINFIKTEEYLLQKLQFMIKWFNLIKYLIQKDIFEAILLSILSL